MQTLAIHEPLKRKARTSATVARVVRELSLSAITALREQTYLGDYCPITRTTKVFGRMGGLGLGISLVGAGL